MPEVRPIDAKALFEFIQKEKAWKQSLMKYRYDRGKYDAFYEMLDIINEQPTLDYEPVVRCKDCVHWKKEKLYIGNNNAVSSKCEWFSSYSTIVGGIYTHRNDFCSYGAKMDEEVK